MNPANPKAVEEYAPALKKVQEYWIITIPNWASFRRDQSHWRVASVRSTQKPKEHE